MLYHLDGAGCRQRGVPLARDCDYNSRLFTLPANRFALEHSQRAHAILSLPSLASPQRKLPVVCFCSVAVAAAVAAEACAFSFLASVSLASCLFPSPLSPLLASPLQPARFAALAVSTRLWFQVWVLQSGQWCCWSLDSALLAATELFA